MPRITPACAGNSPPRTTSTLYLKDHPRVCGEQLPCHDRQYPQPGSPPRVRGTVQEAYTTAYDERITPACAGNSFPARMRTKCGWDHPRVCGEQSLHLILRIYMIGSPPRVRGTGKPGGAGLAHLGITPACAGNSSPRPCGAPDTRDHPRVCGEQFSAS